MLAGETGVVKDEGVKGIDKPRGLSYNRLRCTGEGGHPLILPNGGGEISTLGVEEATNVVGSV